MARPSCGSDDHIKWWFPSAVNAVHNSYFRAKWIDTPKASFFLKYAQKYWGNDKYSLQILLGKICLFFGRLASHDFMWKKEDKVGNKTGYKKRKNGKGKKKRGRKKDQNNFGKKSKGCLICMCKPKSYLITSNYQQSLHFLPILMLSNWLKLFHKKRISINWICFLCYSLADAKGLSPQHHILQTFFYITLVLIRRNSLKSQRNFLFSTKYCHCYSHKV